MGRVEINYKVWYKWITGNTINRTGRLRKWKAHPCANVLQADENVVQVQSSREYMGLDGDSDVDYRKCRLRLGKLKKKKSLQDIIQ